jgi:hypothetical protein
MTLNTGVGLIIACGNMAICFFILIPSAWRNLRRGRQLQAMREIIWAYETDLRKRGVTLPPRCVNCLQVLPGHVDSCMMRPTYDYMDWVTEVTTRPKIKYFPKGERPPEP